MPVIHTTRYNLAVANCSVAILARAGAPRITDIPGRFFYEIRIPFNFQILFGQFKLLFKHQRL